MNPFITTIRSRTTLHACYIDEILAHAGLFAQARTRGELTEVLSESLILLLVGHASLDDAEREALDRFVQDGGVLIAVGGTWGLESLLGVERVPSGFEAGFGLDPYQKLGEGSVQIDAPDHPILRDLESSLHTFGGVAARATEGRTLAQMRDPSFRPTGFDALVERRVGQGYTLLIAPDLCHSVVHIQQGTYVDQDAVPAADGTANLDDRILKCEDGMVLNFEWDRTKVDGKHPIFYHPVADELRELLLRAILYGAQSRGIPLPMLWYYPRNLPALGHLSHDTDINEPALAERLLQELRALDLRTTWCIIEPGYRAAIYEQIKAQGGEIALHFDALDGCPRTSWGEWPLRGQYGWLTRVAGGCPISNKNHYTRWEGRLDWFRWCAAVGIQCDQSKGPSKAGTIGYPFGGCHPWFPIEDDGTFIDCLELNLQTQDLVVTSPGYFGHYWVDQAVKHHGVAHLLFHPAHIAKPGVAEALREVVGYGREQGLEWWTCAEVNVWEHARRGVRLAAWESHDGRTRCRFTTDQRLEDATLLFLTPPDATGESVERYGFSFRVVIADLEGEQQISLPTA